MVGAFKAVITAVGISIAVYLLTQMAFFFPFYMTIVVEAFNLSNIAANDNYVERIYYEDSLYNLRDRPVFNRTPSSVAIEVLNADGREAVGDDPSAYSGYDGDTLGDGTYKPYRQRGEPVTVTVSAVYPVAVTLWGNTFTHNVPVSFEITSVGLRYYKDLEWDY
ncbi:hypothetical protein AGMMS49975_02290 [Clostridia bacterium]|nr:hypothetical protein AGMMS49975_02290 [Clostridia bacterium]